jgi:hypothetical protein
MGDTPNWFRCYVERRESRRWRPSVEHRVALTGRTRTRKTSRGHSGRSTLVVREYRCSCGHVGWSNHVDLARRGLPCKNYDRCGNDAEALSDLCRPCWRELVGLEPEGDG